MTNLLDAIDGYIFDLDGTVYLGDSALPGAVETISTLRTRGKGVLFVTNKPLEPRQAYAAKLSRLGIPATPDEVITSTYVLGHHLAQHAATLRYFVIGEANLLAELGQLGLDVIDVLPGHDPRSVIDPTGIDAVIVAFDRTLDYAKLNTAYQALRRGARYFATNGDKTCPMPGGDIPDAGATLAALQQISGRTPELIAGKPSPLILQTALQRLGLAAGRCLMVGDRLETDIRMGAAAGMRTAVVLTGVTTAIDAEAASPRPDLVLEHLGQLRGWLV